MSKDPALAIGDVGQQRVEEPGVDRLEPVVLRVVAGQGDRPRRGPGGQH
jgi:hypothetical protein